MQKSMKTNFNSMRARIFQLIFKKAQQKGIVCMCLIKLGKNNNHCYFKVV